MRTIAISGCIALTHDARDANDNSQHCRPCNVVSWNPQYHNQLAAGLDKVRSAFSLLVWDVEYAVGQPSADDLSFATGLAQPSSSSSSSSASSASTGAGGSKAFGPANTFNINPRATETIKQASKELANSEATVGLSWLPGHPYCLAAGTGVKWLRIYDMRIRTYQPSPAQPSQPASKNISSAVGRSRLADAHAHPLREQETSRHLVRPSHIPSRCSVSSSIRFMKTAC